MSNTSNLEREIADMRIGHGGEGATNPPKTIKKIGPAVPPKPKKSQPQVPQSYTVKAPPMPSYSTVLNNGGTGEKASNLYMNSPSPYVGTDLRKNEFPYSNESTSSNGSENAKFYHSNENFYTNQREEKFEPKYGYDRKKNLYSNVEEQRERDGNVGHEERQSGATRNAVYSNIEPPIPIPVPTTLTKRKDLIYSNIEWNPQAENTYSNIGSGPRKSGEEIRSGESSRGPCETRGGGGGGITGASLIGVAEELPPPPEPSEYVACVPGNSFPPAPEELPPPPSPVSSSYSELRRATYQTDYPSDGYPNDIYGVTSSQSSSTYESIYEPINPRPPSQLSCNYSMYSGYGSAASNQPRSKVSPVKEVDALTDLLVQGMEDPREDSDIYGICAQCDEKVEGEGTGCSAMDKVFHINCFCCYVCRVNLQGKPFYSLEGKPYCEEDYLNTLEKCCVCTLPILDRILRATGKPYHPSCFTCVVCGQSLDGIPFTVDATNQIHCIQCFHKKFAPRCCVCKLPIMPEPGQDETVRVVALDRSFHIQCYKCEDCGLVLSSESEGRGCYPLDDHVLCKSCNATRVQALTSHMTTEL